MDVNSAINKRRSFRAYEPVVITPDIITDLAEAAHLAPSCFNNQPWRFLFIVDKLLLDSLKSVYSSGNEWARAASMVIAVLSKPDYDCVIKERKYYQFDTGMATGLLLLRATEMGLIAHPIAGFNVEKTHELLTIPPDVEIITLILVGKHGSIDNNTFMSDKQKTAEANRPERKPLNSVIAVNHYPW